MSVYVVDTQCANIASMLSSLGRLGVEATLGTEPSRIEQAPFVVLPGVGTFGAAMNRLSELKLTAPLKQRLMQGKPTLCVCVGFQVLFERSEESPGIAGLGWLKGPIKRFPTTVRVPQFGWNHLRAQPECRLLKDDYVYFANSYYADDVPETCARAQAEHGVTFVAGLEQGAILGCQFHPELSSNAGLALLTRWLGEGQEA